MGLFKADFYRFFALGFAGGAALVFSVMGAGSQDAAGGIVAAARAAPVLVEAQ